MMAGSNGSNTDRATVEGFGYEWSQYDQSGRSRDELLTTFERYFAVFPWDELPASATGVDVGCGTGRWARLVAERVGHVYCVDPSLKALGSATKLLEGSSCTLLAGSAGALPLKDECADFAYSLGVLHHTPDPLVGLRDVVRVVRPGGPLLVYLYYALDNRSGWFRVVWRCTNLLRRWVSRRSPRTRLGVSSVLAYSVYWPLSRLARAVERLGLSA